MTSARRILPWLSCAACCVVAGCSFLPKSRTACGNCVPSAIAEVPSTYENYTPPQPSLQSIPTPVELPPQPDSPAVPPPPSARLIPDSDFDFFDQNAGRSSDNAR